MALSRKHKVTLAAALIGAAGAIIAALLGNSNTGSSNITQTGNNSNLCANNSQCTQGH